MLYELIRETGSVTPQELHQRYEAVSEAVYENRDRVPIGKRARRNRPRKLDEYGLIEIVGANRHREYRVADEEVTASEKFEFTTKRSFETTFGNDGWRIHVIIRYATVDRDVNAGFRRR